MILTTIAVFVAGLVMLTGTASAQQTPTLLHIPTPLPVSGTFTTATGTFTATGNLYEAPGDYPDEGPCTVMGELHDVMWYDAPTGTLLGSIGGVYVRPWTVTSVTKTGPHEATATLSGYIDVPGVAPVPATGTFVGTWNELKVCR
jgi:hypothetical protein